MAVIRAGPGRRSLFFSVLIAILLWDPDWLGKRRPRPAQGGSSGFAIVALAFLLMAKDVRRSTSPSST